MTEAGARRTRFPSPTVVIAGGGLAAYVVVVAVLVRDAALNGLTLYLLALAIFAPLAALVCAAGRSGVATRWGFAPSPRIVAIVVLAGAAALQIAALTHGPTTSSDVYRYVWDGRVQFDGIDPYRYPPQAPELAHLRDRAFFPDLPASSCPWPIPDGCSLINRPAARTIYPPVAQLVFGGVHLVTFGKGGVFAFQVLAALGVLAVTALLLRVASRRGQSLWPVAVWAWSPLVVLEYGSNAHLDWAAALLGAATVLAAGRGRTGWTGVLLGLATLTKLYPAALGASVLRRRPWLVIGAAVATAVVLYLPHVVAAGADVVGYLPR